MESSRIDDIFLSEVFADASGLFLDAAHSPGCGVGESLFGSHGRSGGDGPFQIGIEQLIGVQLRRVTGQVKDFDLLTMEGQPLFDQLAVMDSEIIQDQKIFRPAWWISRFKKSIRMRALSAPEKMRQRIWPLLVTVEMMLSDSCLLLIRTRGVSPFNA